MMMMIIYNFLLLIVISKPAKKCSYEVLIINNN